jgi:hypothetical protein
MFVSRDRPPHDAALACRPAVSTPPSRTPSNFPHSRRHTFRVFKNLRSLLRAPESQTSQLHSVARVLSQDGNLTLAFPFSSGLFVHSFARVQYSTTVFSGACGLFRKNTRGRGTPLETTTLAEVPFPASGRPSHRISIVSKTLSKRSMRPIETLRFTCGLHPRIFAPLTLPTQEAISKRRQS